MPYFRFDEMKSHHLNPHLSTTQGPVIEAATMYFRCVTKQAGQQSKLHYHPNEFMAFLLEGEFDSIVGDEPHRVQPGTLVHIPSNAQHSFRAGPRGIRYLYLKDRTWTLIGAAADEALPDKARSATEVARHRCRQISRQGKSAGKITGDYVGPWQLPLRDEQRLWRRQTIGPPRAVGQWCEPVVGLCAIACRLRNRRAQCGA